MVYFSEAFGIDYLEEYDWCDPILEVDSLLFVDPFLIFKDKSDRWTHAHDSVMDYFHNAFELLARSGLKKKHQFYQRVLTLMRFPEPEEFRLGYTKRGSDGSGSGKGLAAQVTSAMASAIRRGAEDIRHFEELGIFVEKFNRDRISDVVCNLLKPELIAYTQEICERHDIPMVEKTIDHSRFDEERVRWMDDTQLVPVDPATDKPVLLVPKRFLRELPTLDAEAWYDSLDTSLRDDWNLQISRRVRKEEILKAARRHFDSFQEWIHQQEAKEPDSYDVDADPKLYIQWQRVVRDTLEDSPVERRPAIKSEAEMVQFVHEIIGYVRHFAESSRGWELFWVTKGIQSIPETSMQILLLGLVKAYCDAAGVWVDREIETGRGPVDFTFTGDQRMRVVMEMKKLNHGAFWNGLHKQLPIYADGLEVHHAVYLAVRNSVSRPMNRRWRDLDLEAQKASAATGLSIEIERIDVMPRLSASESHNTDFTDSTGEPDDAEPN